jgi:magnesium transporter
VSAVEAAPRRRLLVDGVDRDASDEAVAALLADPAAGFLWLDIAAGDEGNRRLLSEVFGFHPLAVEDADHFGQRPKIEDFDDHVYLVAFGAAGPGDEDGLAEVHLFHSGRYLVSVHCDLCPALDAVRRRALAHPPDGTGVRLLHRVLDELADSFFPVLDEVDARIIELEQTLDEQRSEAGTHQQIFDLRRRLVAIRRVVAPARDQMARIVSGSVTIPGMEDLDWRYFRDIEDHLIRMTDALDSQRDLLAGLTDVHLSTMSNRLNVVMKQLSVVAGVFLPLTFLTGFFGQNFPWMVEHVGGMAAFLVLGIGLQLASVAGLLHWFRRRGWI